MNNIEYSNIPPKSTFLVTGGAGFIGSNLCEFILKLGHRVKCLDNLSTGKIENLTDFIDNPEFKFIHGDIRDLDVCIKATLGVDFVLHQAAWGSVPRSIEFPLLYQDINVKGTLNMLEASRINKVKKFVYASSSSVYGNEPNLPKKEGREGELLSPYAITKKTNEEYAKIYTKLYGLETFGLRYFNVFGKRQNPDGEYAAVIPKFIHKLIKNETPQIFGDGHQSRDFTFISNVIDANLKACMANHDAAGEIYNIAFGKQEKLLDIYEMICKALNKRIQPEFQPFRKGDIMHSHADIDKAKLLLNYNPKDNFQVGLESSINYYLQLFYKI